MLRHVEQSKPHEILGMLLEALVTEIEVSIHTWDDTQLKDSSQAAFVCMVRIIDRKYGSMIDITADKYVTMWREAIRQGKGPLMNRVEKAANAGRYEKALLHIQVRLAIYDTSNDI